MAVCVTEPPLKFPFVLPSIALEATPLCVVLICVAVPVRATLLVPPGQLTALPVLLALSAFTSKEFTKSLPFQLGIFTISGLRLDRSGVESVESIDPTTQVVGVHKTEAIVIVLLERLFVLVVKSTGLSTSSIVKIAEPVLLFISSS